MASNTMFRKAIGAVKDQTSIGIAKVVSQTAPELKIAIVKATSHDADSYNEKYIREILNFTSYSRLYVNACIGILSRRLSKTRNWVVALKSLILIHRLLSEGDSAFQQEIVFATRRGTRLLNMSDFRDEAHSNSWDHSAFVRTYALYLDQKLECLVYERKDSGSSNGRDDRYEERHTYYYGEGRDGIDRGMKHANIPLREMKPERVLARMNHLQRLLDRLVACRPTGSAKNCRMVYVALYSVVKESFKLYGDICEVLSVLLDGFFDMEYDICVKTFEVYASVAKQIDELVGFYNWCKDTGVARTSEFPEVQRITDKLLETLEEFMRDRAKKPQKSPEEIKVTSDKPVVVDLNEVKALPAPPPEEDYSTPPPPEPEQKEDHQLETNDLVDLREDVMTSEDQSNKLALALFQGNGNGYSNDTNEVNSAWEISDKADWELALVESVSNLSKHKVTLGGGFDPLLLNGMYDQGLVRQHTSTAELSGGSASSVALPVLGKSGTPVLALPAPDGSVKAVGQDPFAASLAIPPPSYVQMADMEKKQQLLVQEQKVWEQYARDGMQGQLGLGKISEGGYYMQGPYVHASAAIVPYGMQPVNGVGQGGYYYGTY